MKSLKNLFAKLNDYVWSFFCSAKAKPQELQPLDPQEKIYEDYMHTENLQELNDIFTYVRSKENALKTKCKKLR